MLIENNDEESGRISICEEPYIPFVWEQDANIRLSVSGGAFHHIDPKQLKFVRWTEGAFKDWGNCGACANGAVTFTARVPLWSYSEPDSLYGDFTTETWRQYYLTKDTGPDARNLYQGYDIAFRTEENFRQFLKDYEGTVFKGNWENQIVLWCFRHENRFLPQHEWDKIDAPAMERVSTSIPNRSSWSRTWTATSPTVTVSNPKLTISKTIQLCRQQQQEQQAATLTCSQVS